ncbi:MAG: hypothetical protein A3F84_15100 [Candidatus Handelsmanbacteria bacterium RIFCSPLOWO2_12_FULL_64_10]|uniref:Uncharacterized protein n=1 Tax=Handelsmanbacteria sp. (strain RIFCSPLOWO2_12_FULL_64_10) TaxID=1817868 RepID=A0A1F6CAK9_HANXR|nr:MAG: hypothetical protein A3F84_15100 [Candidatus Handelsmanbacteria bacterium RIFCSPLOWO2_12_FULL_64_10]
MRFEKVDEGFVNRRPDSGPTAVAATQRDTSGGHTEWQDFAFGEPSVTPLPDGSLLVVFWCIQPAGRGIGYVRLRMR